MKLGFLGSGKMATALAQGVVQSGVVTPADLFLSDCYSAAADALAKSTGGAAVAGNLELVQASDTVILCVKPGDALTALWELDLRAKLVISIVAGLSLRALEEAAGAGARVVRVMPNTPALIQQGAAAYSLGSTATKEDATVTEQIFRSVGTIAPVKEELLDAVTGLSGSGPAYVYLVIEALADGGVLMGLSRDLALKLAAQTVAGAAGMVLQTGQHPAVLKDMVTSPGGTTIAGLEELEAHGLRSALLSAVRAATERSRQLGAVS